MTQHNREHVGTILVYREGFPDPDGVFVSTFGRQIGLGLTGDVEIWLNIRECQHILAALQAAVHRVKERKQYEAFSDFFLQQTDDDGIEVPSIVLVSDHRGEIGLYAAIKDDGGGQVWMGLDHCQQVIDALRVAIERAEREE